MSRKETDTVPHYDRHADISAEQNDVHSPSGGTVGESAVENAAEALREVEVQAAQPEPEVPDISTLDAAQLEAMNIDALRVVAREMDIPDRATITEKDDLVAMILQRL